MRRWQKVVIGVIIAISIITGIGIGLFNILVDENSLSKNIVIISNDSYIFKGTIKDNLLMAKQNASEEEMLNIINFFHFR